MKLQSSSFQNAEPLKSKYTFDGANVQPHLKWGDAPANTKSFAISCIDPDAPAGDWVHWLVYDIPQNVLELAEGETPPGKQLRNDFGNPKYEGPSPPRGTGVHRYFFTVYALPEVNLQGITKQNFVETMNKKSLAKAIIYGTYTRDTR